MLSHILLVLYHVKVNNFIAECAPLDDPNYTSGWYRNDAIDDNHVNGIVTITVEGLTGYTLLSFNTNLKSKASVFSRNTN